MSAEKLEGFVLEQIKNMANNPTVREKLILDKNIEITSEMKDDAEHSIKALAEIPRKRKRVQDAYMKQDLLP